MKRDLSVVLSLAIISGILAGCGSGSSPSSINSALSTATAEDSSDITTATGSGDAVVELTFTGWEASPLETEAVENGIKIFESEHPNIKVSYTPGLSGTEYTAKLLSSAAAGSLPDIMFMQSTDYRTFASKGIIMDVTDRFDSEFSLDDFIDSSRSIMDFNGKVYGVSSCTVMPIIY